ncbi:MAG TPA: glycosyltransferase family 2 protein [Campylobacterales bacterium]|nr:glycosyltransferase family 2 protein [Campylobacterales bacterium]
MSINTITPVIIAKDAEHTIKACLKSLKSFTEVILYVNNCTDNTETIAKTFTNVKLIHGDFLGFGQTKNKAASHATNSWVLSLDADEILGTEIIKNLQELKLNKNTVYSILRTNYYKTTQIKHCWGNDILVRLYNKEETGFINQNVHEYIIQENMKKVALQGTVKHYPYSTISDFITKLDRYSTLFANDNVGKKKSSPSKAFFNGLFSFTKTYVFKQGFRDGYAGLIIAFSHMTTNFYKYIKLYEMNKELKS